MPTVAQITFSASGRLDPLFEAEDAPQISVALKAPGSGTTVIQRGTVMGEVTGTHTYSPYASGASDGSQNPAGLLVYTCTVDPAGNITSAGEFGQTLKNTPMFMGGIFKTSELTGLDANAVTKLGGVLIEGSVTDGIFKF